MAVSTTDDINVSPEEMAALMDTIQDTSNTRTREDQDGAPVDVVGYDLMSTRATGNHDMPILELLNDKFGLRLATALENLSGQSVTVKANHTESMPFVECVSSLFPTPVCAQVVELHGLEGHGVVTVSPTLLLQLFDYLLGGVPLEVPDADAIMRERGMTTVEKRLFGHIVDTFSREMSMAWASVADIGMKAQRVETDPKHLALFDRDEAVMCTKYETSFAGCEGTILFVIPRASMRPLEKKLSGGLLDVGGDEDSGWREPLERLMGQVRVSTVAELGSASMSLRELSQLEEGQVLRLDRDPQTAVTVYVEGVAKLQGMPTVQHGNLAIEVTEFVERNETTSDQESSHE